MAALEARRNPPRADLELALGRAYQAAGTPQAAAAAREAFVSGLNEILLVGAIIAFAGAILGFVLVRQRDFVASGGAHAAG